MTGLVAPKTMRASHEVMRCERGYRGRHMAEGNKWRGIGDVT
jgi:hypothetical protein